VGQNDLHQLAEKLSHSQVLKDYEQAFSEATGLPLAFHRTGHEGPGMPRATFLLREIVGGRRSSGIAAASWLHLSLPTPSFRVVD